MSRPDDPAGGPALASREIIAALGATSAAKIEMIRQAAERALIAHCGPQVFYRGLIEFANTCRCDCLYCGIRRSRGDVRRYQLAPARIVVAARWCAEQGYGSVVLQAGERQDGAFVEALVETIIQIKRQTRSSVLPQGLGITLCVGEQPARVYRRLRDAGAHRYLLRIETSNPALFARIHPPEQSFAARLACLQSLRECGFQVGTGVMIGLPGQTSEDLAADVAFFRQQDVDMVGMGPYVAHAATPLAREPCPPADERLRLSLLMIAVTRLALPDINIAATTALQALDAEGRLAGLRFGANVLMPLLTPTEVRADYLLYPGKPVREGPLVRGRARLEARLLAADRPIARDQWGDSPRAGRRRQHGAAGAQAPPLPVPV
jgi:biotin synthase